MSFVVGALPYSGWEQIVPWLEMLGWVAQEAKDIEHWQGSDNGEAPVLVIHRRPEYLIASAIAAGLTPNEASEQWQQQATKLLAWLKFNRRRVCLVETDALLSADANLLPLCERLGVTEPVPDMLSVQPPHINPLHLLFALQALRQSEQGAALLAELDASTLPLTGKSFVEPVIGLNELAYQLQDESSRAQANIDSVQVLIEQQKQQNHELERQLNEARQLSQQQAQLNENNLQQSRKALEALQQQLRTHKDESALLLDQLHLVQEELETVLIREKQQAEANKQSLQRKQADLHTVETELAGLKVEHESLLAQHKTTSANVQSLEKQSRELRGRAERTETELKSEKAAAQQLTEQNSRLQQQLDAVRTEHKQLQDKLASAEKTEHENLRERQQLQQENTLLLEQLHLVQEALEQKFHSQQQLETQLSDSDAALAVANSEIAKLQSELNRIKSSRFYSLIKASQPKPKSKVAAKKRKLQRDVRKLKASSLFDAEWYLMTHADVAQENMDPAEHYIKFGAAEGRDPSPHFNTGWYLQVNPDVAESAINPLIHFMEHGRAEGRAPRPEEQSYLPGPRG